MNSTATAYGGNEKYIFVSYSHRDSETVLAAITEMQNHGYRIWFDKGIEAGTEWSNNIATHLRDCDAFVAFISKNSVKSENCLDEIAYAKSHGKPSLLIFLEEGVALPEGTEMQTARFQRMFFNRQSSLKGFIENLESASILSACRDEGTTYQFKQPYSEKPQAPKKPQNKKLFAIIGIAIALIAAICIIIALASGGDGENVDSSLTEQSVGSIAESSAPVEESKEELVMSDDVYDATFILEGDIFKLPCNISYFTEKGWAISSSGYSAEMLVNGLSTDNFNISKNGKTVGIDVGNRSGDKKPLSDCPVIMITVSADNGASIELAKGITVNSTVSDISSAYGVPHSRDDSDTYESLLYVSDDEEAYIGFEVYKENTERNVIELACYRFSDVVKTETKDTVPDFISQYSAPAELGNDIFSGNFKLEESIYRIPAPVKCFLDNGWTVSSAPSFVAAGCENNMELSKGNAIIEVDIVNFADYQTIPENCVITNIAIYDRDNANIELPNGVTIGMTEAELDARLPDDINKVKNDYSVYYSHSTSTPRDFYLYLYIDVEDGDALSYIRINSEEWD